VYLQVSGDGGDPDGPIRGAFPLTVGQQLTLARDAAYRL
jgi:hypothetical protein